jgi:glycogen operon protein
MIRLRREHPIFHRRNFFQGRPVRGSGIKDVIWLSPEGHEMTDSEWRESQARSLGMYLSGAGLSETDEKGTPLSDATFLVLFNARDKPVRFRLPDFEAGSRWLMVVDTAFLDGLARGGATAGGAWYTVHDRALVLLQQQKAHE